VGVNERVVEQLEDTGLLDLIGEENIFPVEATYGGALHDALTAADAWIAGQNASE